MKRILLYSFLLVVIFSCNESKQSLNASEGDTLLAEVGNKSLYLSAIPQFNFENLNAQDSISFLKNYSKDWIRNQVFISKAEAKISNLRDIEISAQKYKEDLILASYKKVVADNFKAEITEKDLEEYYNKHKEYFLFEEDHYEIKYIIVPTKSSNLQQIRKALSKNETSTFIDAYCSSKPEKCGISENTFKSKKFLKKNLKLTSNLLVLSKKYYYHYLSKSEVMIYSIKSKQKAGTIAPIELVQEELKTLCLHNKKQEYLLELEEKTYQKAKNDKIFENYIN